MIIFPSKNYLCACRTSQMQPKQPPQRHADIPEDRIACTTVRNVEHPTGPTEAAAAGSQKPLFCSSLQNFQIHPPYLKKLQNWQVIK